MRVSVVVTVYKMKNWQELTKRNIESILIQSFRDFEIVVSDDSDDNEIREWLNQYGDKIKYYKNPGEKGMPNNTNHGMDMAKGELTKILYQDDYFYDERSLWDIVRHFTAWTQWMITPCIHTENGIDFFYEHRPYYSESENTLGSPSVLTLRSEIKERFDPRFSWVLDLDFYKRLFRKYGKPKYLDKVNVVMGFHQGQMTYLLCDERKQEEFNLMRQKYG